MKYMANHKVKPQTKNNIKTSQDREKMIVDNLYIVDVICKKYQYLPFDQDTIRYGATIGLIRGIDGYNSKLGKLKSYLYYSAANYARVEMSKDWPVTICHSAIQEFFKLKRLPYTLVYLNKDYYTSHCNRDEDSIEERSIENVLPELKCYDTHKDVIVKEIVEKELNYLKPLEKDAILIMYGNGVHTLKEVGKKYKVSGQYVHQIGIKAFNKLSLRLKKKIKKYES